MARSPTRLEATLNASPENCSPSECIVDMKVIESLRELGGDDDPGLVTELIALFLADAPKRLVEIESGLATGDTKLLERAAHTLKSSAANVGAAALSKLCREIEERVRNSDLQSLPPLCASTKGSYGAAADVLRSIR